MWLRIGKLFQFWICVAVDISRDAGKHFRSWTNYLLSQTRATLYLEQTTIYLKHELPSNTSYPLKRATLYLEQTNIYLAWTISNIYCLYFRCGWQHTCNTTKKIYNNISGHETSYTKSLAGEEMLVEGKSLPRIAVTSHHDTNTVTFINCSHHRYHCSIFISFIQPFRTQMVTPYKDLV